MNKSEQQLWNKVTRDVRQLDQRQTQPRERFAALLEAQRPVFEKINSAALPRTRPAAPLKKPSQPSQKAPTYPQSVMEAGDPRIARHIRRGKREIDATVDLHGLTQEQAYSLLQNFLMRAKARDLRTLLVITGKGARETMHAPVYSVSRGVLRHRFLEWVEGPFREHITSVKQAHQRHGGTGAFYVLLKK